MRDNVRDIRERTFEFALRIMNVCNELNKKPGVCRDISRQLLRSGTSAGANAEEAQAAQSKPDFISKNSIALKEARETHYWLRLLIAAKVLPESKLATLREKPKNSNSYSAQLLFQPKGIKAFCKEFFAFSLLPFALGYAHLDRSR